MKKPLFTVLVPSILLLAIIILTACSSPQLEPLPDVPSNENRIIQIQDDKESGTSADSNAGAHPVEQERTSAEEDSAEEHSDEEELRALFENAPPPEHTVTYKHTFFNGTTRTSETTEYVTEKFYRSDFEETFEGETLRVRQYMANNTVIECVQSPVNLSWACAWIPPPDKFPNDPDAAGPAGTASENSGTTGASGNAGEKPPGYTVTKIQGRGIARSPAYCFETRVPTEGVTETSCYSPEAVLLYFKSEWPGGWTETEATRYVKDVAAGSYILPVTEEEIILPEWLEEELRPTTLWEGW